MAITKAQFSLLSPWYIHELPNEYIIGLNRVRKNFSSDRASQVSMSVLSTTASTFYSVRPDYSWMIMGGQQFNYETANNDGWYCVPNPQDFSAQSLYDKIPNYFNSTQGITTGQSYTMGPYYSILQIDKTGVISTFFGGVNQDGGTTQSTILGEDINNFYVLSQSINHASGRMSVIWSLNKTTLVTNPMRQSYGIFTILENNDGAYIFATAVRGSAYGAAYPAANITYFSLNKSTWTFTSSYDVISIYRGASTTYFSACPTNVTADTSRTNTNKHYLPTIDNGVLTYKRLSSTPNTDIVSGLLLSSDTVACSFLGVPTEVRPLLNNMPVVTVPSVYHNQSLKNYVMKSGTKEFLIVSNGPSRAPGSIRASTAGTRFLIVFEIDTGDTTRLTFRSIVYPQDRENAVLVSNDFKTVVIGSDVAVRVLTWDDASTSYIPGPELYRSKTSFMHLGVDTRNQIWIREATGLVSVLNISNSVVSTVTASSPSQTISSYPSTVNFTLTSKTGRGSLVAKTLRLSVAGGLFSNGLTTITVTTVNGTLTVPVTVSGPGVVTVDIIDD